MSEDLSIAAGLVRLSFLVQSVYAEVCEKHDLTPQQAQLLCVLAESPRGMAELVQILRIEKSSVTGLVDRVERKGWLSRTHAQHDGRAVLVELTEIGSHLARVFRAETTQRLNETVACMPTEIRDSFASIATQIVREHSVPEVFTNTPETVT
jgi:DNA-binding MarR family transcriptional regulator